ncbi:MAG: DUF4394 domain-containing protein [Phycisphaerales bacterium]
MKNVLGLTAVAVLALAGQAMAQTGYGITRDNRLVSFAAATPGTIDSNVAITGLGDGEQVLSIDARPANLGGQLVILTNASRLYSVGFDGTATALGAAFTPALNAADYSIDFNPTVDRIRVVGGMGGNENFRLNPVNGSRVAGDTALSFPSGGTPNAVGTAYRFWNFGFNAAAGSVRQYILHSDGGLLSLGEVGSMAGGNASFNGGVVTIVGGLGVLATDNLVGFDIFGPSDTGFVSANGINGSTLYTLDFATGAATAVGAIGVTVADVTFLPTPGAASLMGLAGLVALRRRR